MVQVVRASRAVVPAAPNTGAHRFHTRECGLTLPSSGPAYGRPLKSNVRPRWKPDHEAPFAVRCVARAIARYTGCRRCFEFFASFKTAAKVGAGCPPPAASARPNQLEGKGILSVCSRTSRSQSRQRASGRPHRGTRKDLVHSLGSNRQLHFKLQSGRFRIQPWYALPSKSKPRLLPLPERGLTLPSSGHAYGMPLKSNVRALSSSFNQAVSRQSAVVLSFRPRAHGQEQRGSASREPGLFVCHVVQSSGILRLLLQVRLASVPKVCRAFVSASRTLPRAKTKRFSEAGFPLKNSGTLRSREPNLKYKNQVQEHKEHELGTVVATRRQPHERPNPSFKRTCLRHAA